MNKLLVATLALSAVLATSSLSARPQMKTYHVKAASGVAVTDISVYIRGKLCKGARPSIRLVNTTLYKVKFTCKVKGKDKKQLRRALFRYIPNKKGK